MVTRAVPREDRRLGVQSREDAVVKKRVDLVDKSAYVHPDIPRPGDVYQVVEDVIVAGTYDSNAKFLHTRRVLYNTQAIIARGTLLTFIGVASPETPAMGVWLVSGVGIIVEHPFVGENMDILELIARAR